MLVINKYLIVIDFSFLNIWSMFNTHVTIFCMNRTIDFIQVQTTSRRTTHCTTIKYHTHYDNRLWDRIKLSNKVVEYVVWLIVSCMGRLRLNTILFIIIFNL
jgi:hypothetical protein